MYLWIVYSLELFLLLLFSPMMNKFCSRTNLVENMLLKALSLSVASTTKPTYLINTYTKIHAESRKKQSYTTSARSLKS